MAFTKARSLGDTRGVRRMGCDEEEGREEIREMLDDPDVSAGEVIAALIKHCPEEQAEDLHHSLREMSADSRGHRAWARDKLERRRYTKDARRHGRDRRMGRDFGTENLTDNTSPRIEEFGSERDRGWEQGEDRRGAMDMAFDGSTRSLDRLFANAARIQKFWDVRTTHSEATGPTGTACSDIATPGPAPLAR